jgi:hypothetical protein
MKNITLEEVLDINKFTGPCASVLSKLKDDIVNHMDMDLQTEINDNNSRILAFSVLLAYSRGELVEVEKREALKSDGPDDWCDCEGCVLVRRQELEKIKYSLDICRACVKALAE